MSEDWESKIQRERQWVERFAQTSNLALNPVPELLERLLGTMAENMELYGRRICPCREATGDPAEDRRITCPCTDHVAEIAEGGTCHCTLFGRPDLPMEGWQREIGRLMAEFSLERYLEPTVIDGRGLTCPGPVFLAKRELLAKDPEELTVLVDTPASVTHLTGLAARYGRRAAATTAAGGYRVQLSRLEKTAEEEEA